MPDVEGIESASRPCRYMSVRQNVPSPFDFDGVERDFGQRIKPRCSFEVYIAVCGCFTVVTISYTNVKEPTHVLRPKKLGICMLR